MSTIRMLENWVNERNWRARLVHARTLAPSPQPTQHGNANQKKDKNLMNKKRGRKDCQELRREPANSEQPKHNIIMIKTFSILSTRNSNTNFCLDAMTETSGLLRTTQNSVKIDATDLFAFLFVSVLLSVHCSAFAN